MAAICEPALTTSQPEANALPSTPTPSPLSRLGPPVAVVVVTPSPELQGPAPAVSSSSVSSLLARLGPPVHDEVSTVQIATSTPTPATNTPETHLAQALLPLSPSLETIAGTAGQVQVETARDGGECTLGFNSSDLPADGDRLPYF